MDVDVALISALGGAITTVVAALLGKETVGRWLLSGQLRETTALEALTRLVTEAVNGWRESNMAYIQLATNQQGMERESLYHYQDLRDRLENQFRLLDAANGRLDDIAERQTMLVNILANGREKNV